MSAFDLIYIHKATKKIFYAKKIIPGVYKIREGLDTTTERKVTRYELSKDFEFQEKASMNEVRKRSQPHFIPKMA